MTPVIRCQKGLPICALWDELVDAIRRHRVILVTGETGSGKTTQLPKICLQAGRGKKRIIGCCQPRRIAAVSVAKRVSQELGPGAEGLVGYQIRFSKKFHQNTKIKFMTDGILLAEVQQDSMLRAYDTIILDEAHERSINIDLVAGLLKNLLKKRRDLRVIVTSATMEVEKFKNFFNNPPLFQIPGRSYPVEILYERETWYQSDRDVDLVKKVAITCSLIRKTDRSGHILVFLPTERHIFDAARLLKSTVNDECLILPLFARLAAFKQSRIFRPSSKQKIILATNIAETSITVPGIRYVIDSGLARISTYNINTHTKALPVAKIAKANANQRAGRAGRVQKGLCIRLYSEEDFACRDDFLPPEINRCNLAEVILKILYMGLGPVEKFPFVDPPKRAAIKEGMHTLLELGAIDKHGRLTSTGKKMARLPIDPRLSRILFQAKRNGCLGEILVIVSALSIQDLWLSHAEADANSLSMAKTLHNDNSDFITFINIWKRLQDLKKQKSSRAAVKRFCKQHLLSYQKIVEWQDIYQQIKAICMDLKLVTNYDVTDGFQWDPIQVSPAVFESIHKSILAGFLGHVACKNIKGAGYTGAKGKEIYIFPGSTLFKKGPQWIVSAEQIRTSRLFARTVAPIKPEWVEELAPQLCKYHYFEPKWSAGRGEAVIKEKVNFYGMTIIPSRNRSLKSIDKNLAKKIFIEQGLSKCNLKFDYSFKKHNAKLLEEFQQEENKRRRGSFNIEVDILFGHFEKALARLEKEAGKEIVDEYSLRRVLRKRKELERFLYLDRKEILKQFDQEGSGGLYPGSIEVDGQKLPLIYRFDPGNEDDGIHVRLPLLLLPYVDNQRFNWLVPGFLHEKILFLLKGLPKRLRKELGSLNRAAELIEKTLVFGKGSFRQEFCRAINRCFGLELDHLDLPSNNLLPLHLTMTFDIIEADGTVLASSKNLHELQIRFGSKAEQARIHWKNLCFVKKRYEKDFVFKEFSGLPREIAVGNWGGIEINAFPGICTYSEEKMRICLFLSKKKALLESAKGLDILLDKALKKELKQLKNSVHQTVSSAFEPFLKAFPVKSALTRQEISDIKERVFIFLQKKHYPLWKQIPSYEEFTLITHEIKKEILPSSYKWLRDFEPVIRQYVNLRMEEEKFLLRNPGLKTNKRIVSSVENIRLALLEAYLSDKALDGLQKNATRYLKALRTRINRAESEPSKDISKESKFQPVFRFYLHAFGSCLSSQDDSDYLQELQKQVFEFMVSIFAPELSKRGSFSQKKLSSLLSSKNIFKKN